MIIMYHMFNIIKHSNIRIPRVLFVIFFSMLLLSCGNKGPLTIPQQGQDNANLEKQSDKADIK